MPWEYLLFLMMRRNKIFFSQFFVPNDQIQKLFDQKELQIKMSSLLNVSNGNSKPEEFNLNDIEVLVASEEQNWFKKAHVGKFLGLVHIHRSTARLTDEDQKTQAFLQAEGWCHNVTSPREDAQDHDIFISLTGALYVVVNSRKDKGKTLKKHILKDIVPHGFDAKMNKIQGEHNHHTRQLQQTIHDLAKISVKIFFHDLNEIMKNLISTRMIWVNCFH